MLPDGDGANFCEEMRSSGSTVPLLMLTARGEVADRVRGLRAGADDYLVKPFDVEELLLRVEGLGRRGRVGSMLRLGELTVDPLMREARVGTSRLELTAKELQLLVTLASGRGEVLSRSQLLQQVWGLGFDPGSGVLDVHVSRLRDKLGAYAWMVETVRGSGLRFRSQR
jgi:DNA-binding response OmpR family regulator